jgi:hypothetical protein
MALTQHDLVSAITKLNELTRQRVIKWQQHLPSAINRMSRTGLEPKASYETVYDGRVLRLTEYASPGALTLTNRYVLEVRDHDGNVLFEFPDLLAIPDLFRSIVTQEADLEEFIKKLATTDNV